MCRKAPDEGGERRELPCLLPLAFHSKIKSTLRCARVPSSALRAPSPVNGRRASECWVTPPGITIARQIHPLRSTLSRRGCQETIDEVFQGGPAAVAVGRQPVRPAAGQIGRASWWERGG